jgi:hypothetical protein
MRRNRFVLSNRKRPTPPLHQWPSKVEHCLITTDFALILVEAYQFQHLELEANNIFFGQDRKVSAETSPRRPIRNKSYQQVTHGHAGKRKLLATVRAVCCV